MTVMTENCPRCGADMADEPGGGALSRVDNTTYICSDCGQGEALFNFFRPGEPLSPVTEALSDRYQIVQNEEMRDFLRDQANSEDPS